MDKDERIAKLEARVKALEMAIHTICKITEGQQKLGNQVYEEAPWWANPNVDHRIT